jgi:hypothetical protein
VSTISRFHCRLMILGNSTLENEPESELVTSCGLSGVSGRCKGGHIEDKSGSLGTCPATEPLAFLFYSRLLFLMGSPLGHLHCLFNRCARRWPRRISKKTIKVVVFQRRRSSHLCYTLYVFSQCQTRVKLNRVFFPR